MNARGSGEIYAIGVKEPCKGGFLLRSLVLVLVSGSLALAADAPSFEKTVAPVLSRTCSPCHNESMASGNMNIAGFTKAASLAESREGWDIILRKIKAGEMPPKGMPRPAELDAAVQFVQAELEKADRNVKPD